MRLGDVFPDFSAETDRGKIDSFHDWIGDGKWAIVFSHPADFTPVCTTELARAAQLAGQFEGRGVRMLAVSCDSAASHRAWIPDIATVAGEEVHAWSFPFEMAADEGRALAEQLGMIDPDERDAQGMPLTARAVFVIGPDRRLKLQILYPATTGRNFDEILRVIDSLQLTARCKVATPVDWRSGDACCVQPSVSKEEAATLFPDAQTVQLPSGKGYLRTTKMEQ